MCPIFATDVARLGLGGGAAESVRFDAMQFFVLVKADQHGCRGVAATCGGQNGSLVGFELLQAAINRAECHNNHAPLMG